MALALSGIPPVNDPRILVGSNTADDAGVIRIDDDLALVHTVDVFAPVVDDPFTFGKIAAINSISDVYAMGGRPIATLNVIGFPSNLGTEVLGEILRGAQEAVLEAGAVPMGGHTFQDSEVRFGLAVTGKISPDKIITNAGAKPGDKLILTKKLGTGTVVQAIITRGVVSETLYRECVDSMMSSNRRASELMIGYANACTDITGFGFAGHCWEIADASGIGAKIYSEALPVFPKVLDLIGDGIVDAAVKQNRNSFEDYIVYHEGISEVYRTLLFSSETSGGLLIAVPEAEARCLVDRLQKDGEPAAIVGEIVDEHPGKLVILP